VGRIYIFAGELVFLDVVCFLADRLLSQGKDMPALERSALVVLSAPAGTPEWRRLSPDRKAWSLASPELA
jgi:hypothetical protein